MCRISSLQVVDNVISNTHITGPLHHSSQWLFMITLFNQLWSVVIITNNSTNFIRERWKEEWSVHIQELWLAFCNSENFYYFPAHYTVSFSLIRAIKSTAIDVHPKRLWKYTWHNWACSNLKILILEIVLTATTTVIYQYNPRININVTWKCTLKFQWHS